MSLFNILLQLQTAVALKKDKPFLLKSGKESNIYFNMRLLTGIPSITDAITNHLNDIVQYPNTYLCGCGGYGNTLASVLSVKCNMPLLILRDKPKDHGEDREIIGLYEKDYKECILIDDVFTTGTTILEIRDKLSKYNINVHQIVTILNRSDPYMNEIDDIQIKSLFNLYHFGELMNYRHWIEFCMNMKKSRICRSYDKDCSVGDVCRMMKQCQDYLFAVKLHPEFISDIQDSYQELRDCALETSIVLVADMKYCDIGHIVKRQYESKVFCVNRWANLVTCHAMNGAVEALIGAERFVHHFGVLIVANMSTGYDQSEEAVKIAQKYKEGVCGFVTQTKLLKPDDNSFLHFTPGVKLVKSTDDNDQNYNTPEFLKENAGTDAFIIGRGLEGCINVFQKLMEYNSVVNGFYYSAFVLNGY